MKLHFLCDGLLFLKVSWEGIHICRTLELKLCIWTSISGFGIGTVQSSKPVKRSPWWAADKAGFLDCFHSARLEQCAPSWWFMSTSCTVPSWLNTWHTDLEKSSSSARFCRWLRLPFQCGKFHWIPCNEEESKNCSNVVESIPNLTLYPAFVMLHLFSDPLAYISKCCDTCSRTVSITWTPSPCRQIQQ